MKSPFTKAERLLLSSQLRILAHLTGAAEYDRDLKILESGFVSLHEELVIPFEDLIPSETTSPVAAILEMYSDIYAATNGSPHASLTFSGFCDPPEGHELYFAKFVREELGRHAGLGEIPIAASPMMPKYLRMLSCYKQREDIFELSSRDLVRLAKVADLSVDGDEDGKLVN